MKKEELLNIVQEIFRDIFDDESLIIDLTTNSSDIDDWDSLNHINLVVAIEKEIEIKFNFEELSLMKNVGEMLDLILKK
tara:strand:- start:700 stop:936 length:237 start_codon:yes stop_codon:yes gene_type:complete